MISNRRFFRDNRLFELLVIICVILSDFLGYYFNIDVFVDLFLKTIVYCLYFYLLKQLRDRVSDDEFPYEESFMNEEDILLSTLRIPFRSSPTKSLKK